MNDIVEALAVSSTDLYLGGAFTIAGGRVSPCIARSHLLTPPTLSVRRSGANVMVLWPSADTVGFALEEADTLSNPTNWITNTVGIADDGTNKSVTLPATNRHRFFRLRWP